MLQARTAIPVQSRPKKQDAVGTPLTRECPSAVAAKSRAGDWVEVRSKEEILATLDERGRLDGMPFMPQMFRYCGQQFQVHKRAHKTCDTVSGNYRGRTLPNGVHLDLRCDGKAYGGCQAACLIFWKEAWLKPIDYERDASTNGIRIAQTTSGTGIGCTEAALIAATRHPEAGDDEQRYSCQATELLAFTKPLNWWDPRQYAEDYSSGNVSIGRMASGFSYAAFVTLLQADRRTIGKPARWLYDRFQIMIGGNAFPRYSGTIPVGQPTPRRDLGLEPGDLVRVKSYEEILKTVDAVGRNRSMGFDAELVPYCGKEFRVRNRVEVFVDEQTGHLRRMKTPAVILEGVYCLGRYSSQRMLCPRAIYSWWREIWLERSEE